MTFKDFEKAWLEEELPIKSTQIRKGQSLINYLAKIWFNEYKRIQQTNANGSDDVDCFYDDRKIPKTLEYLEKVWSKYPN